MSVPNTHTFSLQDVAHEIYGSSISGKSLRGCFTDSVAGKFDPTYKGSKDRLSNFRNYGATLACDLTFCVGSGSGTAVAYKGGYYSINIVSTEYDVDYLYATLYDGTGGYVATEYLSAVSGVLATTSPFATVHFYVVEVEPVTTYYSAAVNKYFVANDGHCNNYSCPPGYTAAAIYHGVYAYGAFTSTISQADADAQAEAAGQAAANATPCACYLNQQG
jgi:hypothetical protein